MHFSSRIVIAVKTEEGERKTTLELSEGGLPLFTAAFKLGPELVLALGWSSGGGGQDSQVAWLISLSGAAPLVIDTLTLDKPRPAPSLAFDEKTGRLVFFHDGPCPKDDFPRPLVRLLRGAQYDLCKLPVRRAEGGLQFYEGAPSVTKSASKRLAISVKAGAFVAVP